MAVPLSLAASILSMLWYYRNNPRPGPRTVGLLCLQGILIKALVLIQLGI